jgi:secondary thiamine-phosphate synthase enzyme
MNIKTEKIFIETKKDEIFDITKKIENLLKISKLKEGNILIFSSATTCSLSLMEYEEGLLKDLKGVLEKIAPEDLKYFHNRFSEDNGKSHVKSTILGSSLTIPFLDNKLFLGRWQSIIFLELDTRNRRREIIVQFLGI